MKEFFTAIRPMFGKLSQEQVDGLNFLLDATEGLLPEQRAYLLATVYHETAKTMQPILERGNKSYFDQYETGTRKGKRLGNTEPGDGYRFRGRGYVQITGRRNYALASRRLGIDFVGTPNAALNPKHSAEILVRGCQEGWFTGVTLDDCIKPGAVDYLKARKIVNGTDKARLIAGHARRFEGALKSVSGGLLPDNRQWSPLAALWRWIRRQIKRK